MQTKTNGRKKAARGSRRSVCLSALAVVVVSISGCSGNHSASNPQASLETTLQQWTSLRNEAYESRKKNDFVSAEKKYRSALDLIMQNRKPIDREPMTSLYELGHILSEQKKYKEAIPILQDAIKTADTRAARKIDREFTVKHRDFTLRDRVKSLFDLACCYRETGELQKSEETFKDAIKAASFDNTLYVSKCNREYAVLLAKMGKKPLEKELAPEVGADLVPESNYEIGEALENENNAWSTACKRALNEIKDKQFHKAMKSFEEAQAEALKIHGPASMQYNETMLKTWDAFAETADAPKTIPLMTKFLQTKERTKNFDKAFFHMTGHLGCAQFTYGQRQKALATVGHAIAVAKNIGAENFLPDLYTQRAQFCVMMGSYAEALNYFRTALPIVKKETYTGRSHDEALIEDGMAISLYQLGKKEEAVTHSKRAFDLAKQRLVPEDNMYRTIAEHYRDVCTKKPLQKL